MREKERECRGESKKREKFFLRRREAGGIGATK